MERLKHINPFLYYQKRPLRLKLIGLFGFLATLFAAVGFVRFLSISVWYWVIFGPIATLFILNHLIRYFLQFFYPKDLTKERHLDFVHKFWSENEEPSVDVFLPWAGEDLNIYEETLKGVSALEYKNKKVYILDDKGDDGAKELAKKYSFEYLSRPNKGEYKKSGNLQYGYDHSNGEFAFVLDADFIPIPSALWHTVPYIYSDKTVGILQTPQYFEQTKEKHDESPIEYGGGNIVEEFYKVDQVCRDRFDAAICVGTSALYRRKAIMDSGGTPKVWGTEDVRTGLLITRFGFHVKYIPLIVSIGTSPDDVQGYFRQHSRWCSGSLAILAPGEFYTKAKLSFSGRIIYLFNPTYYIVEALAPLLVFHLLALLAFQPQTLSIYNSFWFLPKVVYSFLLSPVIFRNHRMRFGSRIASFNNIFTYFYTIFFNLIPRKHLAWHPAGVSIGGISKEFRETVRVGMIISTAYVISLILIITINKEYLINFKSSFVLIWALYIAIWYVIYMFNATHFLKEHDAKYFDQNSKLKTYTRRVWAHVKHYLLPALMLVLFMSVVSDFYTLKNNNETGILLNASNNVFEMDKYSYIAEDGDSLTKFSRSALLSYINKKGISLSAAKFLYSESFLANSKDTNTLKVGDEIIFSVSDIENAIEKSNQLSPSQLSNLQKYIQSNNLQNSYPAQ